MKAQASSPATGGIRYIKGAVRATPRTAFTQPQASQPRKAETTTAHTKASANGTVKAVMSEAIAKNGLDPNKLPKEFNF